MIMKLPRMKRIFLFHQNDSRNVVWKTLYNPKPCLQSLNEIYKKCKTSYIIPFVGFFSSQGRETTLVTT